MNLFSNSLYNHNLTRTNEVHREISQLSQIPDNLTIIGDELCKKYKFKNCIRITDLILHKKDETHNSINLRYRLTLNGDTDTLSIQPSSHTYFEGMSNYRADKVGSNYLDIMHSINYASESLENAEKRISGWNNKFIKWLDECLENQKRDFNQYNITFEKTISSLLIKRQLELKNKAKILESFKVDLIKESAIPVAFKIEKQEMKIKTLEESQTIEKYPELAKEAYLAEEAYKEILNICYEWGKAFEKYPHISKDMGEEMIRDIFLTVLSTHFKGTGLSGTGETFNKGGKTDILVKYNNDNIFVAECKFWSGEKHYTDTINQLYRYLTWRDSKTAIFIFIRDRNEIKPVLEKIKNTTKTHSYCLKSKETSKDGWYGYEFNFKDDKSISFQLNVLCFCL